MGGGGGNMPKPSTAPPPKYEEVVAENQAMVQRRMLSLERALGIQQQQGASQLTSRAGAPAARPQMGSSLNPYARNRPGIRYQ